MSVSKLVQKLLRKLPAKARCRKCHKSRAKSEFGVRIMERDKQGKPTRVARQSWCGRCR